MRRAHSSLVASILAVSMATSSCSKSPAGVESVDPASVSSGLSATAPTASGSWRGSKVAHSEFLKSVPVDSVAVATVMVAGFFDSLSSGQFGLVPSTGASGALRKSLGDASRKDFGVDLFLTRSISAWVAPMRNAFLITLTGPFDGELRVAGLEVTDIGGTRALALEEDLFVGLRAGQLIVGNRGGFTATPGSKEGLISAHTRALEATQDGFATVTAAAPAELASKLPIQGLDALAVALTPDVSLTAVVLGKPEALDQLTAMYETVRGPALAEMKAAIDLIESQSFPGAAILATLARAASTDLEAFKLLERRDPSTLVATTPAVSLQNSAVVMIPVLAAVAVPSFIKYMRRAKTTEAIDQIDKIYKASASYFSAPRVAMGTGAKVPCAFPPSAPATPPLTALCCDGTRGTEGRCNPSASDWAGEPWLSLFFQMNDPHYFHYAYTSSGTGNDAKFTVSAHADLDCDGEWSTFERYGYAEVDENGECSLKGSAAFFKEKETE